MSVYGCRICVTGSARGASVGWGLDRGRCLARLELIDHAPAFAFGAAAAVVGVLAVSGLHCFQYSSLSCNDLFPTGWPMSAQASIRRRRGRLRADAFEPPVSPHTPLKFAERISPCAAPLTAQISAPPYELSHFRPRQRPLALAHAGH